MSSTSIRNSYDKNTPLSVEQLDAKRHNSRNKSTNYWMALGGAFLALTGAVEMYNVLTSPKSHTVTEIARPGDSGYTLAQRAESQFGKDPGEFNPQREALRINDEYGTIQPGERVKVHVK